MKKLIMLMVAAMLVLALAACAVKTPQTKVPIKCPACGYEGLDYIYQP